MNKREIKISLEESFQILKAVRKYMEFKTLKKFESTPNDLIHSEYELMKARAEAINNNKSDVVLKLDDAYRIRHYIIYYMSYKEPLRNFKEASKLIFGEESGSAFIKFNDLIESEMA